MWLVPATCCRDQSKGISSVYNTKEKFENAVLFLRSSLPSTLIRHEKGTFRKHFSNRRNLKTPAFLVASDGCVFKFLRRNVDGRHLMRSRSENSIFLCHQTLAMYPWAWKTRGSQTERFLLLHITTITWHLGMEDWITVGHGACDIVTTDNGYRLICRKSTEWKVLVLKVDRMQISGWRAIRCLMAWTVWISLITKRMEELR